MRQQTRTGLLKPVPPSKKFSLAIVLCVHHLMENKVSKLSTTNFQFLTLL